MNTARIIKKYSSEYYNKMFSIWPDISKKESIQKGKYFLQKYAMDEKVFRNECFPIMQKIYKSTTDMPFNIQNMSIRNIFQNGYKKSILINSPLFNKDHFLAIQKIAEAYKEKNFFIIEDEMCEDSPEMAFKLKIPVNLTWEELTNGGCISDVVLNMPQNDFYVFGESGKWGRWCDYENPWIDYEVFGYIEDNQEVHDYLYRYVLSKSEYDKNFSNMGIPPIIKSHLILEE